MNLRAVANCLQSGSFFFLFSGVHFNTMKPRHALSLALDPGLILKAQGLTPDPWQRAFLLATDREVLLNCCRQSGKSTTTAALAVHTALFRAPALVLVLSP